MREIILPELGAMTFQNYPQTVKWCRARLQNVSQQTAHSAVAALSLPSVLEKQLWQITYRWAIHVVNPQPSWVTDQLVLTTFPRVEEAYALYAQAQARDKQLRVAASFVEPWEYLMPFQPLGFANQSVWERLGVRHIAFTIKDHSCAISETEMRALLAAIHTALGDDGDGVAVFHCKAGVGRSMTALLCYLLTYGMPGVAQPSVTQAYRFLQSKRRCLDFGNTRRAFAEQFVQLA